MCEEVTIDLFIENPDIAAQDENNGSGLNPILEILLSPILSHGLLLGEIVNTIYRNDEIKNDIKDRTLWY